MYQVSWILLILAVFIGAVLGISIVELGRVCAL